MAAVSITVFEENKVLYRGCLQRVSDVEMSLVSMLQGLLSTSETSESVVGRLHSVSIAASVEGIHLDMTPDNKFFLHVEFGRRHVFFNLCGPLHSEDLDPTASSSRPAHTINDVLLEAASKT